MKIVENIAKVLLPILIGGVILWWMYRGMAWEDIRQAVTTDMDWTWMLLSLPFGITAQLFRALRWRQALEPMGEKARRSTCINAIFLSYGSSLVVPRVGEFLRCGVLKRWDGVSFSRGIGTVVTERVVDVLMILVLSGITILMQLPAFIRIAQETGMTAENVLNRFTPTGYLVTALCLLLLVGMTWWVSRRFDFLSKLHGMFQELKTGIFSIRYIRKRWLFICYSLGIWVSYFLHFYLTFYCFSYTQHLGVAVALVAFVVGTFAVVVPTPNGAGPWHFAIKTVLVLWGVNQVDGALFALIVHTIQTALVALLGVWSVIALAISAPIPPGGDKDATSANHTAQNKS